MRGLRDPADLLRDPRGLDSSIFKVDANKSTGDSLGLPLRDPLSDPLSDPRGRGDPLSDPAVDLGLGGILGLGGNLDKFERD